MIACVKCKEVFAPVVATIGNFKVLVGQHRDMFCAGRVDEQDLNRTMKACGGAVLTTVSDLNESNLGRCEHFEEVQVGKER